MTSLVEFHVIKQVEMQVCNKILPDMLKSDINHKIDMIADSLFAKICCVNI